MDKDRTILVVKDRILTMGKGIDLLVITMDIKARVLVVINPSLIVLEMATFGLATHLIDKRSFLNVRFV